MDEQNLENQQPSQPEKWLGKHESTRHFLVEFFVILFSNLTNFFKKKDKEIEQKEHITDSVIKHD